MSCRVAMAESMRKAKEDCDETFPEMADSSQYNSSVPSVIRGRLKWKPADWSLDQWKQILRDKSGIYRLYRLDSRKIDICSSTVIIDEPNLLLLILSSKL